MRIRMVYSDFSISNLFYVKIELKGAGAFYSAKKKSAAKKTITKKMCSPTKKGLCSIKTDFFSKKALFHICMLMGNAYLLKEMPVCPQIQAFKCVAHCKLHSILMSNGLCLCSCVRHYSNPVQVDQALLI